jgi:hypothetical protein
MWARRSYWIFPAAVVFAMFAALIGLPLLDDLMGERKDFPFIP